MTRIKFHPPADNERGPKYLEPFIESWLALVGEKGMRLGIATDQGQVVFLVDVPQERQRIIAAQLENTYPGGKAEVIGERDQQIHSHKTNGWLRLSPDAYPLKLHQSFVEEHSREALDPLEGLLEIIKSGRSGRVATSVWLELKPHKKRQLANAKKNASLLEAKFPLRLLRNSFEYGFSDCRWRRRILNWLIRPVVRKARTPEAALTKLEQHLFAGSIRIEVSSDTPSDQMHKHKLIDIGSAFSLLTSFSALFFLERYPKSSFLLTAAEIATLWHIPTVENKVPRLERSGFKELEPPSNLPRPGDSPHIVTLGRVCFRNERYKFGMDLEARRRHLWILGKTGMGKSTLLKNIMIQDLQAGRGFALLEPHGDLAEGVLSCVPKRRKNDIIYFDPADENNKITFNPLMVPTGSDKTLVADGVLSAFQRVFGFDESLAPRMIHIFRNCLLSLVEMPNATLLDVQRLLVESLYRKSVIARVSNPVVRSFWLEEFGKWKPHDRTAFIASLQNKLGAFLANPKLQKVLGDPKAKLDLRKAMDDGKVLIVNLSKGRLGENASSLLGTLVVAAMQLASMSRANISEADRRDFSIIMDEFQNFATASIATFLSEARKYRTHLILANQYTQQVPEAILSALIGNVGSQIAFRIGPMDAELMKIQFFDLVTSEDITTTPKYHCFCSLALDGSACVPFSMTP